MECIKIKPLSVNKCWMGRRFKTSDYKSYEKEVLLRLKKVKIHEGLLSISLEFGMSKAMDIDNPVKPFIDILQKKMDFNDNRIYELNIKKVAIKKGNEYIKFKIETL